MAHDIPLGLTFDDVLLQPQESSVLPSQTNTSTRLTRGQEAHGPPSSVPIPGHHPDRPGG